MADSTLLDRPPTKPEVASPEAGRADGYPNTNARGQFRSPVHEPEVRDALRRRALREIAEAEARVAGATAAEEADAEVSSGTAVGIDEIPIAGWIVAGVEGGVAVYEGVQLYRALRDLKKAQAELKALEQEKTEADTNVKVKGKPCLVDEYQNLKKICDGEAHHIMPDMVYRLGGRPSSAAAMSSTADRIPNAPTLNQGMAICLTTEQHAGLHGGLRTVLNGLGAAQTPSGTAPMGKITLAADGSILAIKTLPAECKALAIAKLHAQLVNQGIKPGQPGRTQEQPLPSGDAETVLRRGSY